MKIVVQERSVKVVLRLPRWPRASDFAFARGGPRCLGRIFICGGADTGGAGMGAPDTPNPKPKRAKAYEKLHVDDDDGASGDGGIADRSRGHRLRRRVGIATTTVTFARLCRTGLGLGPARRLVGLRSRVAKSGGGDARRNSVSAEADGTTSSPPPRRRSLSESIVEVELERPVLSSAEGTLVAACKQFRQQLMEMVTEENRDLNYLMDVEQIVYCYHNLKCPFYREILGRFYAEICSELFLPSQTSSSSSENENSPVF